MPLLVFCTLPNGYTEVCRRLTTSEMAKKVSMQRLYMWNIHSCGNRRPVSRHGDICVHKAVCHEILHYYFGLLPSVFSTLSPSASPTLSLSYSLFSVLLSICCQTSFHSLPLCTHETTLTLHHFINMGIHHATLVLSIVFVIRICIYTMHYIQTHDSVFTLLQLL